MNQNSSSSSSSSSSNCPEWRVTKAVRCSETADKQTNRQTDRVMCCFCVKVAARMWRVEELLRPPLPPLPPDQDRMSGGGGITMPCPVKETLCLKIRAGKGEVWKCRINTPQQTLHKQHRKISGHHWSFYFFWTMKTQNINSFRRVKEPPPPRRLLTD